MSKKKPVLLFITHDVSRTGAPILLLNLMKLLKESGYTVHCLVKNSLGTLMNEFSFVAETCLIYNRPSKKNIITKYKRKFEKWKTIAKIKKLLSDIDIIFSNTITNGDIIPFIKENSKAPVISYIHELKMGARVFTKNQYVENVIQFTDYFLAPSKTVKNFLQTAFSINEKKISILPYFLPILTEATNLGEKEFRKSNNIHATFIAGCMGTTDWRKSPDLFVQVAVQVFKLQPGANIQFIWKGGFAHNLEYKRLVYDIENLGFVDKILLLEHSADIHSFYETIDLLILTSREDPYPLVVLEAASNKIPTICFSGAGGAVELVETDAGTIVDYLDILSMAKQVLKYYNDDSLRSLHGARAYEKVKVLHQDKVLIVKQIEEVFKMFEKS